MLEEAFALAVGTLLLMFNPQIARWFVGIAPTAAVAWFGGEEGAMVFNRLITCLIGAGWAWFGLDAVW